MRTVTVRNPEADMWIDDSFDAGWVSVVIPTYNRGRLLEAAVLSVIQQAYRPIECLIIDDGSVDDTALVVEGLKASHESDQFKILYLTQPNQGAPTARNAGIIKSRGEFIQFLDSDDLLYPEKLRSHVEFLQSRKAADAVFGDWDHGTGDQHQTIKGERCENLVNQFYGGRVIHTLSFLFRRGIVARIGPWDNNLKRNQEIDFHLRGALLGANFEYLPSVTGLWRVHDGERIVTSSGAIRALEFHDKWIAKFDGMGLLDPARRKIAAQFIFWHALDLGVDSCGTTLHYLQKTGQLNPELPEFNTQKMRWLKKIIGVRLAVCLWHACWLLAKLRHKFGRPSA